MDDFLKLILILLAVGGGFGLCLLSFWMFRKNAGPAVMAPPSNPTVRRRRKAVVRLERRPAPRGLTTLPGSGYRPAVSDTLLFGEAGPTADDEEEEEIGGEEDARRWR